MLNRGFNDQREGPGPVPRLSEDGGDSREEGDMPEEKIAEAIEAIRERPACRENSLAITKLEEALHWLKANQA
jgi:hypothetical protein